MPGKAADKRALDAAERRRQCLDLRRAGMSFRTIGRHLDISEAQAHRDYMAALSAAAKLDEAEATHHRALDVLRLDAWLERIEPYAMSGSPGHINTGLKILERRAKLLGLDAAETHKIEHTGKGGGDLVVRVVYDDLAPPDPYTDADNSPPATA